MNAKYPVDKIIQILAEATLPGTSAAAVCRKYDISQNTFYKWKSKYGGMNADEAKRLKAMEEENRMLKQVLAEKELENKVLREFVKKNS
jgi:putative transposase